MVNNLCQSCWSAYGKWLVEDKLLCDSCCKESDDRTLEFDYEETVKTVKKMEELKRRYD